MSATATEAPPATPPSVAAHPRAARSVARARGWAGLAGFLIAGYLSLPTGTVAEAILRALTAGCVCYVVAWAAAVFLWRRFVILEIKGREEELLTGSRAPLAPSEPEATQAERAGASPSPRARVEASATASGEPARAAVSAGSR